MELDPAELELGEGVWARSFVPHSAVLPQADLLVTHAGIGSVMAAFAAAVPMLCLPLGRDQDENATRIAELGAGAILPAEASVAEIAAAVRSALASASLRRGAERMAAAVAAGDGAERGAEVIERAFGRQRAGVALRRRPRARGRASG